MNGKNTTSIDRPLFLTVAFQLLAGMAFVYASMTNGPAQDSVPGNSELSIYMLDVIVAVGLAIVTYRLTSSARLKMIPHLSILAAVALMVLTVLPRVGHEQYGSKLWLNAGPWAIYVYPPVVLLVVVYFSDIFARFRRGDSSLKYFNLKISGLCLLLFALAIAQRDIQGAWMVLSPVLLMCAVAGARWLALGIATCFALGFGYLLGSSVYRRAHVFRFLDPFGSDSPQNFSQLAQSLSVIGGGDVNGVGLGTGLAMAAPLPDAQGNFIYATIVEQTGVLGACLLLVSSLVILWRGVRIAQCLLNAEQHFEGLMVSGLIGWIGLSTITHVAITLGLWPGSHSPYPLLSYGEGVGSMYLCAYLMAFAIVLKLGGEAPAKRAVKAGGNPDAMRSPAFLTGAALLVFLGGITVQKALLNPFLDAQYQSLGVCVQQGTPLAPEHRANNSCIEASAKPGSRS
jgi:cell division protein FtsW